MKSDLSRRTFDPKKHYSGVRMQQGRVQLDADWNEQAEIAIHREDTEALDVIGGCGGPVHDAAFGVILKVPILALEDKAAVSIPTPIIGPPPPVIQPGPDDFLLSAGRYYVDGILCENDGSVLFSKQPDLPALTGVPAIPTQADATRFPAYLVYLDVWQRNITALDDPAIHEVALGGPDTATRLKTIWQVKLFGEADPSADCTKAFTELKNSLQADGTLNARTNPGAADPNPCIISASAAFRGLENQLYRVEIHNPGPAFDIAAPLSGTPAPVTQINPTTISVPGTWAIGQAVEVFLTAANSDPKARRLFVITGIDATTKNLSLDGDLSGIDFTKAPQLRAVTGATFKWSRDNGSVVTLIDRIETIGNQTILHVSSLGNDTVLGFGPGQLVELSDDTLELNNQPGQFVQIDSVDSTNLTITLKSAPAAPLPGGAHPKVRRWDGIGAVEISSTNPPSDGWIDLENSVQVQFAAASYSTGDYWMIPARTATADAESGNIEWPQQPGSNPPLPMPQAPFGIRHHYCPLSVLLWDSTNKVFSLKEDCRKLFQPLTDPTLYYVDGDGQEAMPGNQLLGKLQVRAGRGQVPVGNAKVLFSIVVGNGTLSGPGVPSGLPGKRLTVTTETVNGIADCSWTLDGTNQFQQVEAVLLDSKGVQLPGPIRFNANLSVASQVAYTPPSGCASLLGAATVKDALDDLAAVTRIYYTGGDGQTASAGADSKTGFITLTQPLEVAVYSNCGAASGRTVRFKIISGGGSIAPKGGAAGPGPVDTIVDATSGVASCIWAIDPAKTAYLVEARLLDSAAKELDPPVHFTASYGPGFRVNAITLRDSALTPLANDSTIKSNQLGPGIAVQFSQPVNPGMIAGKPVGIVTIDVPFPLSADETQTWGPAGTGLRPVTARATLATNPGNTQLLWSPADASQLQAYLNRVFAQMSLAGLNPVPPLLAHLTLKSNFISSAADSSLFLDGDVFGRQAAGNQVGLVLPSGDGRRGGDLDMWFWLGIGPLEINSITFISVNANGFETTIRSVALPPVNQPVVLLPFQPINIIEVAFNRPAALGIAPPPAGPGPSVILESIATVGAVTKTTPVVGTVTQVSAMVVRFAIALTAPALAAGEYQFTVFGAPRGGVPPATAVDDKTPLDGAYAGLPGSDFVFQFSIGHLTVQPGSQGSIKP